MDPTQVRAGVEETPHPVHPVRSMHPYVRNETQIVFHEPLPSFLTYAVHPVHPRFSVNPACFAGSGPAADGTHAPGI